LGELMVSAGAASPMISSALSSHVGDRIALRSEDSGAAPLRMRWPLALRRQLVFFFTSTPLG